MQTYKKESNLLQVRVEPHIAEKLSEEASKKGLKNSSLARMIIYEHYNETKEGINV